MMEKEKAPLYEALVAHSRLRAHPFHVPGHKQRAAWREESAPDYYGSLLALDVTELSDTDDLHHPEGPIAEAQELAADCYGAEETRFLVGGSTAGNLAMVIGLCQPGEVVILQRNVHKSIIHGLMLAGVRAVLLPPDIDALSGLATVPGEVLLQATLERYGEAKAVILSSPNYYGMSTDLKPLAELVHRYGVPVLIDEAHGPHFGFHPHFPASALQSGADLVVQSTHKMLSAMTMGAMLHIQGNLIPRPSIRQALTMVQSSSPSFPIMASLDLARRQLHTQGEQAFQSALESISLATKGLNETSIGALGYGEYASKGISYDPLKLVLFDKTGRLSGFELRDELIRRKCVAEMADARYAVMAFGTGSTSEDGELLRSALADIDSHMPSPIQPIAPERQMMPTPTPTNAHRQTNNVPEPVSFGRQTYPSQAVSLDSSVGLTAAEWVTPYPPGIPVLYPGEKITENIVQELKHWKHERAQIQGAQDPELQTILIQKK
ncbi:aminotransferase class I/II-fold pyridoxal phosphate-dependent enzyme [Cohnella luojiensis]|uniref:Aminotransferase class I/II-fold pyridoxal phosphate-dependent enzyme n=1 Tax=Cohnella luojiensis TaxID=652876 RepID=A0A4Y8LTF4_9BACL|nr:aminotransferase class I/II-fold pyridoxal phosphate-dependent enzyme [Cohnella luojiensis]TFE24163.1 aminotransferase class I/II-fold pyridoxal phosphate-dependent enzyme [Cohnella luojiensis]